LKAIALVPGRPETAGVIELPEPPRSDGSLLIRTRLIGMCGTDREIAVDGSGTPPPGEERLVLGHESLGEVMEAPVEAHFVPGDLVVGVVRRPDPLPCPACAADEWDMCRTGGFVECGIKERHGYGSERFRVDPRFAIRLDQGLGDLGVLLEPTSVVAKAFEHAERIGARAWFEPRVALITGAGPIGLLAALLARQRGLETHVVDLVTEGAKPELVADLGADYHSTPVAELPLAPDLVIECTGVGEVVIDATHLAAPGAVVALTGISHSERAGEAHLDALNKDLVLGNKAVFGAVNAARRHYDQAADALAAADPGWLARLITRRLPPENWAAGLEKRPEDIKVVIDMTALAGERQARSGSAGPPGGKPA
jgi:threonine dehydrogenase-like Zn-dependent dehydrogenase